MLRLRLGGRDAELALLWQDYSLRPTNISVEILSPAARIKAIVADFISRWRVNIKPLSSP